MKQRMLNLLIAVIRGKNESSGHYWIEVWLPYANKAMRLKANEKWRNCVVGVPV